MEHKQRAKSQVLKTQSLAEWMESQRVESLGKERRGNNGDGLRGEKGNGSKAVLLAVQQLHPDSWLFETTLR